MNRYKTIILWAILVIFFFLFLIDRKILFPLLISFWSGQILFSVKFWTFAAVMVALFGKRFNDWLNQPIIRLDFDKNSDRCYRNARVDYDVIQEFGIMQQTTRQYFRLKVSNIGNSTAKRVRIMIDLYYEDMKQVERFEPNCLRWITGDKALDIASGETTYINLLSQVIKIEPTPAQIPPNLFVIRWEIGDYKLRGIAWDRDVKVFIIKLVVHGDNVKARTHWFKFIPEKDIFEPGKLMRLNFV